MVNTIEFYNILNKMSDNLTLQRILEQLTWFSQYLKSEIKIHPDYLQRFIQFCLNPEAEGHDQRRTQFFERIIANSNKFEKIKKAIVVCKEILRKQASNEELTENEKIFFDYIQMISNYSQMISDFNEIKKEIYEKKEEYDKKYRSLESKLDGQQKAHSAWQIYHCFCISNKTPLKIMQQNPTILRQLTEFDMREIKTKNAKFQAMIKKISTENMGIQELENSLSEIISKLMEMIEKCQFSLEIDSVLCCLRNSEEDSHKCASFKEEFEKMKEIFQELPTKLHTFFPEIEKLITEFKAQYEEYDFIWILYYYCTCGHHYGFERSMYFPFPGKPADQTPDIPFPDVSSSSPDEKYKRIIQYLCESGIKL